MSKNKNIKNRPVTVTKTEEVKPPNLIISEINIMSADRSKKDIQSFSNALQSAESKWNPNRVTLYDLYEHIMLDGHLTGIIAKRMDSVLNKDMFYAGKDGKRKEEFDVLIESEEFREVIRKLIESMIWGVSGLEFIPGDKFCFEEIARKHIKPELGIIAFEQYGNEGFEYEKIDNVIIVGKKKDLGLLLKCAPYAIWKRGNMGDWAQYIEIFGMPIRVIKYDAYDQKTKMELRQVLDESGSSLALMIPKQADFEIKEGKASNGDGKLQESFKIACDTEMSIVILGNTETTVSSASSGHAQSKEHSKQQLQINKSDLKFVRGILNSEKFQNILRSYGFPVEEGGGFQYEKDIDLAELKAKMEVDEKLAEKVPVSDDYWYETYGVPKPDNYDELVAKKEADKLAAQEVLKKNPIPAEDEEDPKKTKKPPVKSKKEDLSDKKLLDKIRIMLADFFDPAL